MELRHLQTFVSAAELESFTRAAESLSVTQAAISQHVAALEKELGTRLFERQGRGVRPTECGTCLYGYARQILDLVESARRQIGNVDNDLCGTLRIASSSVPSEWLLPEILAEFRNRCPGIRESVTVSDSRVAALAVSNGDADVGFVGEVPNPDELEVDEIAKDELVLMVSAKHSLASKGSTTLKQLKQEALIVREQGSGSRRCFERALQHHHVSPGDLKIAMEFNNNDAIRAAVQRDMGVAFLSQNAGRNDSSLVAIKIRGFRLKRHLFMIHNPTRIPRALVREFLVFVRERRSRS